MDTGGERGNILILMGRQDTEKRTGGRFGRLLREPLLHFFLLGLAVFGLHAFLNSDEGNGAVADPHLVEITSADIEWLRSTWNKKMGREPTAEELEGMTDAFIREEILYREAVSMGLDQHDTVVRRRMAQKMEFLFKDLAEMAEPTEEELQAWFDENRERYRAPALVSYTHVYFNGDQRGEKVLEDARKVLAELQKEGGDPAEAPARGDRFMLRSSYPLQGLDMTAREFGRGFADALAGLETGRWQDPVVSGYGLHLVYLHERIDSRLPELDEVRERVVMDLMTARREQVNTAAYREIKSKYQVLVENMPYEAAAQQGEAT